MYMSSREAEKQRILQERNEEVRRAMAEREFSWENGNIIYSIPPNLTKPLSASRSHFAGPTIHLTNRIHAEAFAMRKHALRGTRDDFVRLVLLIGFNAAELAGLASDGRRDEWGAGFSLCESAYQGAGKGNLVALIGSCAHAGGLAVDGYSLLMSCCLRERIMGWR
jgi:hypothetical protein